MITFFVTKGGIFLLLKRRLGAALDGTDDAIENF